MNENIKYDEHENNNEFKCKRCENYDERNDNCKVSNVEECSKKRIKECYNYIIKHRMVFF